MLVVSLDCGSALAEFDRDIELTWFVGLVFLTMPVVPGVLFGDTACVLGRDPVPLDLVGETLELFTGEVFADFTRGKPWVFDGTRILSFDCVLVV